MEYGLKPGPISKIFLTSILSLISFCCFGTDKEVDFDRATQEIRKIISTAIEKDTTNPPGNESKVTSFIATILKKKGIPVEEIEFAPGRKNLMARFSGTSKTLRPLILLAHLDVVGSDFQNWTMPAHHMTEKDGYLYGRGVYDDLLMAAANTEMLVLLKEEHFKSPRDIVVLLTGDEESGGQGLENLLKKKPDLEKAALVVNEGGGPAMNENGVVNWATIQVHEKIYQDFSIVAKGDPGHSSRINSKNALVKLVHALDQVSQISFSYKLPAEMKTYFEEKSKVEKAGISKALKDILTSSSKNLPESALKTLREHRPGYLAHLTSTCAPVLMSGGFRANALPAEARATINCRLLPDENIEEVRKKMVALIHDEDVTVTAEKEMGPSVPSPMDGKAIALIRQNIVEFWPQAVVVPTMQLGMTDSRYFRAKGIPAYGLNPFPMKDADLMHTHGADERIPISSLRPGVEFYYRLVKALALGLESP